MPKPNPDPKGINGVVWTDTQDPAAQSELPPPPARPELTAGNGADEEASDEASED